MISKNEYVKLYCNELVYKLTGVIGLDVHKVDDMMRQDRRKTIKDLADYGVVANHDGNFTHIDVDAMMGESGFNSGRDPFEDKLGDLRRSLDKLDSFVDMMTPEEFDWGSEDSIR